MRAPRSYARAAGRVPPRCRGAAVMRLRRVAPRRRARPFVSNTQLNVPLRRLRWARLADLAGSEKKKPKKKQKKQNGRDEGPPRPALHGLATLSLEAATPQLVVNERLHVKPRLYGAAYASRPYTFLDLPGRVRHRCDVHVHDYAKCLSDRTPSAQAHACVPQSKSRSKVQKLRAHVRHRHAAAHALGKISDGDRWSSSPAPVGASTADPRASAAQT